MEASEAVREGLAAARAGRMGPARACLRAALRHEPGNETALLGLAYLAEDPRARRMYAREALARWPDSARARAAVEWAEQRGGEYKSS